MTDASVAWVDDFSPECRARDCDVCHAEDCVCACHLDNGDDAAGVMTDAQLREHNALRRDGEPGPGRVIVIDNASAVAHVADGGDPWYDNPAPLADLTNPEDQHGTSTAEQIRSLQAAFTAHGVKDRDAKIAWLVDKFGPDIHSSKDLSYTQAARALQELR